MRPPTSDLRPLNSDLPIVPGGWKTQTIDLGDRRLELVQPADPGLRSEAAATVAAIRFA